MDPKKLLGIVDSLHREKNIDEEIVFQAIEAALVTAAKRYYGEEKDIEFHIERAAGEIVGSCDGQPLDFGETIGRIGAQQAKQVIIQKVREAERDAMFDEFKEQEGELVSGIVQRAERGATIVTLSTTEAILPRSEQIPGETHHPNERVRAIIFEVRKENNRVKVVLSRTRPKLVQRLFEQEIPEIADGVIAINQIAREPGYRSKIAVSSTDQRVDCVGACVGVRGNRIKNIVDELAGERIDIVRYSDDPQVMIPNALQPAEVDEVILCQMIGRAIVLVREDQLSLAIGRRGQNVRLASKLCGWDIEIMTTEELGSKIDNAVAGFSQLEGISEELANRLVGEGFLTYDDLSVIEPDALMEMGELTAEQVDAIVAQADDRAKEAEIAMAEERRRQKDLQRLQEMQQAQGLSPTPADESSVAEPASSPSESGPSPDPTPEPLVSEAGSEPDSEAGREPDSESEEPASESAAASLDDSQLGDSQLGDSPQSEPPAGDLSGADESSNGEAASGEDDETPKAQQSDSG